MLTVSSWPEVVDGRERSLTAFLPHFGLLRNCQKFFCSHCQKTFVPKSKICGWKLSVLKKIRSKVKILSIHNFFCRKFVVSEGKLQFSASSTFQPKALLYVKPRSEVVINERVTWCSGLTGTYFTLADSRSCDLHCCLLSLVSAPVIPRLHDQANIEQLEHTSCTCILNAFAGCLLDDCSMYAWSCKRGISYRHVVPLCRVRQISNPLKLFASFCEQPRPI